MSYASMVPDKLQSELIQIRDDMTRAYWRIGDICQEVKDYLIFNEQPFSMDGIYSAVGAFVGRTVVGACAIGSKLLPVLPGIVGVPRLPAALGLDGLSQPEGADRSAPGVIKFL